MHEYRVLLSDREGLQSVEVLINEKYFTDTEFKDLCISILISLYSSDRNMQRHVAYQRLIKVLQREYGFESEETDPITFAFDPDEILSSERVKSQQEIWLQKLMLTASLGD